jgi:diguanylate cyclase (GGDEF)-like protein/PAS domain S-box-containing protein
VLGAGIIGLAVARFIRQPFDARWLALAASALAGSALVSPKVSRAQSVVALPDAFLFLTLLLCGAEAAALVGALAVAGDASRSARRWLNLAAQVAVLCCSFFMASSLVNLLFGDARLLAHRRETFFLYALALGMLAAAQGLINSFLVAAAIALKTGKPILPTWREASSWALVTSLAAACATGMANELIHFYGFWTVIFMIPVLLANHLASRPYLETVRQHSLRWQGSEARFRSAFDHAAIGMALVEPNGRWLQVNPSLCRMVGYAEEELLGTNFQALTHPDDLTSALKHIYLLLEGKIPTFQMEKRYVHKLGYTVWVLLSVSLAREVGEHSVRLIFQMQDITDRQRAKDLLVHDAFHDGLTGLPNRALFMHHLKLTFERAQRREEPPFVVLFLDLDRFKLVNDSLGHLVGDQLLVGIARRLESCLRPGDRVARLGGDEFTILLKNINDTSEATEVAERIRQELTQPFTLSGQEVFTTLSIGVAHSALGYEQPEDMLRDADTAMYRAKARGTARHEVFDKTMHSQALSLLQMETDLRRAVERQEFLVHYQPIVTLETGRLRGFEALVRWHHPEQGLIPPIKFIPIAEETGLIVDIGHWALREACRQMREWQAQYPAGSELQMSVNLSGKQFVQPNLLGRIKGILRETGLPPRSLKLEITESVVMENIEVATSMLQQIRALEIELSIDDFGTGYSSLSYLHRFPLNTLKIDRSFVIHMSNNNENKEIVRTIVMLARSLGMDVIAEGVETQDQLAQLWALECKYGQGYFFSKPLGGKAAGELVKHNKQWPMSLPCQVISDERTDHQLVEYTVAM